MRSEAVPVRVSSIQVRALFEGLEALGLSGAEFSKLVRFEAGLIADPYGWVSVEELDRLTCEAVKHTGDEAFGLHWGERAPLMQFDLLPMIAATSNSLRAVIDNVLRFQPVLANRDEFLFQERRDRGMLTLDLLAVSELASRARTEAILTALLRMLQSFGEGASLRRVDVRHARPAYWREYERLFGATVHFGQAHSRLEFARAALDRPRAYRDLDLHRTLVQSMELVRRRVLGERSCSDHVAQLIRASLPNRLGQEDAARALKLSTRTLRRQLALEKVSYRELVERVRCELADELFARGTESNKQLSAALGYTDLSGFHRARRRWQGGLASSNRPPGLERPARQRSA